MFEFLKSTFKKFDDQKKSVEKSGAEDTTQSSSQDELIETRDIFVDPVIKKLKEAKVKCPPYSIQCHEFLNVPLFYFACFFVLVRMYWIYTI